MIYEHLTVKMPDAKRVTKYEKTHAKPYVYEILQSKTKNTKEKVACVGVAIDDENMHPNDNYFLYHPDCTMEKSDDTERVFDDQIHIGSSLLIRAAAKKNGLTYILKECFPGYDELIMNLAEYYMIEKESASQLFKFYLYDHYTELNYIPSESTLSRLFNEILDHEKIKTFLNTWMKSKLSAADDCTVEVDFDSTNFNVSSKKVDSAEYGKAKDDEGLPQVNVAYFLDRKTGLPLYYDIYYGSIIDMEHCQTAMAKIKSINKNVKTSFVMDRGYFSSSNLNYFDDNGYNFLCMGKRTDVFNKFVKTNPSSKMTTSKNWISGNVYGKKEYGAVFSDGGKKYYKYFFYDDSKAAIEMPKLLEQANYAKTFVVGKKDPKGFIQNTYGKLLDIEVDDKKIIVSAELNHKYLDERRSSCGYFWIISNENLSPEEVLNSYRHRDAVEKTFKGIKTDSDLNKLYASSDSAFEAKSLMAFITAIIRADITTKLKPYFIQYHNETSQTVLKEAEKIKAEEIAGKYCLRQALTARQKQILSFYEMNVEDVRECIDTINEIHKTIQ